MKNIIKALKHCVDKDCEGGCPYDLNGCHNKLTDDTIALLTNQKEEIERLQKLLDEKCDILKIIEHNRMVDMSEGFVRRVDDLGRVYIPKELRKEMNIEYGDYLKICFDGDKLYLKKYADADEKGGKE